MCLPDFPVRISGILGGVHHEGPVLVREEENSAGGKAVEELEVTDAGALLGSWAGVRESSLKEDNYSLFYF